MDYNFQINLRGLIDLLSNHLYSGPQVFLRELLQNAVDAITARTQLEPDHQGRISLEVISSPERNEATLVFEDNGIGLTEAEIHQFLATIGQSSKREELADRRNDYIGQFGIGLLSCFVVSDEIVVLTRSIKNDAATIEWRGRPDGTYSIRTLEKDLSPGTRVYLRNKNGCEDYFKTERICELASHFGSLLPYPITVTQGNKTNVINEQRPPWQQIFYSRRDQRAALLAYGRQIFDIDFFDAIPLHSAIGAVEGVAFVLPYSPSLATKSTHRVYLKHMLLCENAKDVLPDWAFFVKCVINANDLRPTASREFFYEDAMLMAAREMLGQCLRQYLIELAQQDEERLQQLINLHYLAIKALAVHDDEFYKLFIDWLPFETSLGRMTLGEYRSANLIIRYVPTRDQFRQIAGVAASQSMCVINGGYAYDTDLLEKLPYLFPEIQVERVDASDLAQSFEDLNWKERERVFNLIKFADVVLQPFRCEVEIKKFWPQELPALYSTNADAEFQRSLLQSKSVSNSVWSSVLDNLATTPQQPYAQLCFNFHNPLIQKLVNLEDKNLLQLSLQMLYVQALLLGHQPLNAQEMGLLNSGLLGLIEWGVNAQLGENYEP
jgi:molecular chaperone HtpG